MDNGLGLLGVVGFALLLVRVGSLAFPLLRGCVLKHVDSVGLVGALALGALLRCASSCSFEYKADNIDRYKNTYMNRRLGGVSSPLGSPPPQRIGKLFHFVKRRLDVKRNTSEKVRRSTFPFPLFPQRALVPCEI